MLRTARARGLTAVVLALLAVLWTGGPALAVPPQRLDSAITDSAGVLDEAATQQQLETLRDAAGIDLYVVFVDSFDGESGPDWARRTAQASGLSGSDVLLAVAVQERSFGYEGFTGGRLSESQVDAVMNNDVKPRLADNDWNGAVTAAVNGLGRAADSSGGSNTSGGSDGSGTSGDGGSSGSGFPTGLVIVGVVLVLGVGLLVLGLISSAARKRRRAGFAGGPGGAPQPPPIPLPELERQASAAVVAADDALDGSAAELGFARAEFGDEATAPFVAAVERARAELAQAFAIQRRLADPAGSTDATGHSRPLDDDTRRALLEQQLQHAEAADAALDEQAEAFEALRDLQRRLPELLPALEADRARLAARLPDATRQLQDLEARYAAAAVSSVADDDEQATRLLDLAAQRLATARDRQASGADGEAAVAVQAVRDALRQTAELLDAVDALARDLQQSVDALPRALAELDADLAEARAVLAAGGGASSSDLAGAVGRGEQATTAARTDGSRDPQTALRRVHEADAALDAALAGAREEGQRTARARAQLEQALPAARAEVTAARALLRTRRGAVGGSARALLAGAEEQLATAEQLAGTDPVRALAAAQQADSMAERAQREADDDLGSWSGWGGGAPSSNRYGTRYGSGGSFEGAVIGGILGGILSGGGDGRSGGFGGSGSWGGGSDGGGFGGGGSFGGGSDSGSFGGGGNF
ncbi:Uncharacterized membrane protein YgcG, contains a TPM-fold domain [Quadrisphaera granulorum]|uniref:Putative membrane protein YgcG n=1 Tax=Quadrisphaera granulorum TaxID=317664 RepID=A0A316A480_9ACTN|nr:TPM domain-containing protein [Quadrisphaera granulorum]PWJ52786.1 putative membrane protein YgcG [Quadrisphaera granulorum]SZE97391.1 Uncharacterized membrane protein YgcG, contains a TPM-fold domain [Quadrisphaera granulorum]